jgi:hypothetical protein
MHMGCVKTKIMVFISVFFCVIGKRMWRSPHGWENSEDRQEAAHG